MYKKHFFKFSIGFTLLFAVGVLLLFVINTHDNIKYGEAKTISDRIRDAMGN